MTKFKISFHCGAVSSFAVEEHESKLEAQEIWRKKIIASQTIDDLMIIGDVLLNPKQLTFVVVEELIERVEEPAAGATIEC